MNRFDHYRTVLSGVPNPFHPPDGQGAEARAADPDPRWPWTLSGTLQKIIRPLARSREFWRRCRRRVRRNRALTPGLRLFNAARRNPGVNASFTADLWRVLMTERVGAYDQICPRTAPIGVPSSPAQLGHKHRDWL